MSVSKLMELKPPDAVSIELRDHVLDLYQRGVLGLIKDQLKVEDGYKKDKEILEKDLKILEEEFEAVKDQKSRLDLAFEEKIMELARVKSDYFALLAQTQEVQKPKEEDEPNYEYVKNVLVSYMMTVDVGL